MQYSYSTALRTSESLCCFVNLNKIFRNIIGKNILIISGYYLLCVISQIRCHQKTKVKNQNDEFQPILHFLLPTQQYSQEFHCSQSKKHKYCIYKYIQFNCLITCLYRRKQGTFLVIRYCFSFGKYDLILHSSPQAHSQVGHVCTKWSPAVTNSFGVTTPVSLNFDSYKTKIIIIFLFIIVCVSNANRTRLTLIIYYNKM